MSLVAAGADRLMRPTQAAEPVLAHGSSRREAPRIRPQGLGHAAISCERGSGLHDMDDDEARIRAEDASFERAPS